MIFFFFPHRSEGNIIYRWNPSKPFWGENEPLSSARFFFSRKCVFLLSRFSLVAVNKAFYCGVVSAIADTVSVQGVPVPGPNPQTNSKEGQGQPSPLLSPGIQAEEPYLTRQLYSSRLRVCGFTLQAEMKDETSFKCIFTQERFIKTSWNICDDGNLEKKKKKRQKRNSA